jgi:hypothetical protein
MAETTNVHGPEGKPIHVFVGKRNSKGKDYVYC